MSGETMDWNLITTTYDQWWELTYRGVRISLERRPPYCDRGNWYAKFINIGPLWIDEADGFPRYYFDLEVAKKELEAFLQKRENLGQFNENQTMRKDCL